MQQPMTTNRPTTFTVHLARSGERQQVAAQDWRSAIKATGRPDACVVDPDGPGPVCVTWITAGTPASASEATLERALSSVMNDLDGTQRAAESATMPTFTVYLARSGERQQVAAQDWRAALKSTGRPDACMVEPQADGALDVTFDPDHPTTITTRCKEGTQAERMAFALATVAKNLDSEAAANARHAAFLAAEARA